jgi:hypothetical protein
MIAVTPMLERWAEACPFWPAEKTGFAPERLADG